MLDNLLSLYHPFTGELWFGTISKKGIFTRVVPIRSGGLREANLFSGPVKLKEAMRKRY